MISKFLVAVSLVAMSVAPVSATSKKAELRVRPSIDFNHRITNNGKTLVATPKTKTMRAWYPDLATALREWWDAKKQGTELLNCKYQRVVVGELACDVVPNK